MPLQQASTYLSVGFPVFTSNGEAIKVPSLTSMGTPTYVPQGSAIPEVNASTDEIELLPSTVHSIKTITRVSRELMRQSVINVEQSFTMKMTSDIARILDAALWNGDGADGAPTGMAQFSGVTSAGTAIGTLAVDDLYDMQEAALDAFVPLGSTTWAMSPANLTRVRKLEDSTGQKFLTPSLSQGAPATLLGSPYVVTSHLPDTTILLFDRQQVAVGMDDRASIAILDQTYANYDEVGIRVTARYDTAALNPTAVVKASGITG